MGLGPVQYAGSRIVPGCVQDKAIWYIMVVGRSVAEEEEEEDERKSSLTVRRLVAGTSCGR